MESRGFLDSRRSFAPIMGLWRLVVLAMFVMLLLPAALDSGEASADNVTFAVLNSRSDDIIPRVAVDSGHRIINYPAVPTNSIRIISLEHNNNAVLFFAAGCTHVNHLVKCLSGDCPQEDCQKENPVATLIDYNNGTLRISVAAGYNVGITVDFQGSECICSSISCVLPLDECPEPQKIWQEPEERGQPQLLVACKSVDGHPFLSDQDCATPGSYVQTPSQGTSCACPLKNEIWKVTIS